MLLTAQPLHAFDLDQVPDGELIVRTAAEGEKMTTLDDVERSFDAETVLVCDRNGPSGIAGIMGGQRSEVSESTTRVLLEVANWNGTNILRTSRLLGLRSEASARFEKQLHPELTHAGAAGRLAAAGRALRREAGAGDDRRRRRGPRAAAADAAGGPGLGLLGMEISQEEQKDLPASGSASRRRPTARTSRSSSRPTATTTSPAKST